MEVTSGQIGSFAPGLTGEFIFRIRSRASKNGQGGLLSRRMKCRYCSNLSRAVLQARAQSGSCPVPELYQVK
jgi:hypothetical protein